MTSAGSGIVFENLSVSYGSQAVLNGISGSVAPGKFVALIGPNGSGKSTLLRALCGLLPYDGSIRLEGREVRDTPRRALGRSVGMLPQQTAIDASLTVYDLISLGRLPHEGLFAAGRTEENERRVLEAADKMQVCDLLFKSASRISGGEAQRSMIAMLLVQNPLVFLLDEPSSATDAQHSVAIFTLFREMAEAANRVVVAAVHDINLATRFANEIIAMKDGNILASAPADRVDGELLESLYDIPFEKFTSTGGARAWHAAEAAR